MLESGIGLGRASGFCEALSGPERRASGSTAESGHGSTWSRGREELGSSWRKRGRAVRSRLMVRKVGEEAGEGPAINVAAVSFN